SDAELREAEEPAVASSPLGRWENPNFRNAPAAPEVLHSSTTVEATAFRPWTQLKAVILTLSSARRKNLRLLVPRTLGKSKFPVCSRRT
ncbi:MAG TPA: hypothetical protein VHU44_04790, partial [Acidobacteriaceae bacterium]|nr:hypothetical protein [Acidobacteriaceae bacterium]